MKLPFLNILSSNPPKTIRHIVLALVVITIVVLSTRVVFTQLYSSTDTVWIFNINLQFEANQAGSVLKLSQPTATEHSRVIRQSLQHPFTSVRYTKNKYDGKTSISFISDKPGIIDIDTEFLLHITKHPRLQLKPVPITTDSREHYLGDKPELDIYSQKITDFLAELSIKSKEKKELVESIYKYARTFTINNKAINSTPRNAPELINSKNITVIEQANLCIALSRAARIPARMVTGFILREQPDIKPHHWVELYFDEKWHAFDIYNGYKYLLPSNYVPFRYDATEIFSLVDGTNTDSDINIVETRYNFLADSTDSKNILNLFDLTRLQQDTRNVLATLLLLPIGILITVLFRHFVGVHNYGVFAPSLLALALTRNDFFTTALTLSIVIFFVITGRLAFPKKMNRTPRLALIFTLVILSMGFAVSFIEFYYPSPEGFAVLLPVVILSSLTDNFYKSLDSLGKQVALIRLFWTAVITAFCLPFLRWDALGHYLVHFPELHLITLACVLLVTSYKGKQLVKFIPGLLKENIPKGTTEKSEHST